MRAMINRTDNSVAFLEYGDLRIHPAMMTEPSIFLVEFDGQCLGSIPEEEYLNLVWAPDSEILYLHPETRSLSTPSGKQMMRDIVEAIALVPPESRTEAQAVDISMAQMSLGEDEVETILTDGVLEDAEIAAILGALDGS